MSNIKMAVPNTIPSYVHTPLTKPMEYKTLPQFLDDRVLEIPDKEAIVFHSTTHPNPLTLTYRQWRDSSKKIATSAVNVGLNPGDRVGILLPNSPAFAIGHMGLIMAGVVPVFLSIDRMSQQDILSMLEGFECCGIIISTTGIHGDMYKKLLNLDHTKDATQRTYLKYIFAVSEPSLIPKAKSPMQHKGTSMLKVFDFQSLLDSPPDDELIQNHSRKFQPESPLLICLTSGSTGLPKGIPYSHHGLINSYLPVAERHNITSDDTWFTDRPLTLMGGYWAMLATILIGTKLVASAPLVASDGGEGILRLLDLLDSEKCSVTAFFINHLYDLLAVSKTREVSIPTLTKPIWGGSMPTLQVLHECQKILPGLMGVYSLSEVFAAAQGPEQEDVGYCGKPYPGTEIKIADTHGNVKPVGEEGEVCIRSLRTAEISYILPGGGSSRGEWFQGGWFRTGDMGRMNDNGLLSITGRLTDIIKHCGRKIYPAEVENILSEHPRIAAVVAVGIPDVRTGEEICACVVPTSSASSLTTFQLRSFSEVNFLTADMADCPAVMPKYFVLMESFPATSSGKVNRRETRSLAIEHLECEGIIKAIN